MVLATGLAFLYPARRWLLVTLGTVVSNVITVVVALAAMARLEWRLTIASVLLLPLFIWPAKRVGKRLATITRDGMQENAEMNNIMTERFGVSGAMLVKTYGNEQRELTEFSGRAAKVRDIGVKSAMLRSTCDSAAKFTTTSIRSSASATAVSTRRASSRAARVSSPTCK